MRRIDAKNLESFLRYSICADQWGYTLFGCKPLSFTVQHKIAFSLPSLLPPAYSMRKGWEVWKKLSIPHPDFVLWSEPSPWSCDVERIFIGYREGIDKIVEKYREDFLALSQYRGGKLLENISDAAPLEDLLLHQEVLLGILLGFGRENCYLFADPSQEKSADIWQTSFNEQIISRFFRKMYLLQDPDIEDMLLPHFVGDPHSVETKELKEKYLKAREQILAYYEKGPFLPLTLSLFVNGSS